MSTIAVSDLQKAGFQLFEDSESFLNELTNIDSVSITGGAQGGNISDPTALTKLAEAFVYVYGIGHIGYLAKSFSPAEQGK